MCVYPEAVRDHAGKDQLSSAQHFNASGSLRPWLARQPEAAGTFRDYSVRHRRVRGFVPPASPHCKLPRVLHAPGLRARLCPQRAQRG